MSIASQPAASSTTDGVRTERTYNRFSLSQRWEHAVLILTFAVLLFTGLPQKYRTTTWSQHILATPERLEFIQDVHHIAAVVLALEALYHLGRGATLLAQRKLSSAMLPTWQDVLDAVQMVKYLLFLTNQKPAFGKYNFEQKFTYWVLFFAIGIMGISGFVMWFPELSTRFLPGEMVPSSKLAHSTEAIVATIFIVIWHFYHVHIERLNLSIFTGRLSEEAMQEYHSLEYQRLSGETNETNAGVENE